MNYKVAIVGATGNVGHEMLSILDERKFPASEVHAIASRRSVGKEVSFGDRTLKCEDIENFDFAKMDFVIMSAGGAVAKEWAPKIGAMGAIVIDNSSAWRYDMDVPLIVPEVNAHVLEAYMKKNSRKNIIANPNCSTAQMVVALKPLHDEATIKRIVVSTYQSVSGAGKAAMDELWSQTKGKYVPGQEVSAKKFTKEEWKMMAETKKILDPKIRVVATCVRVPVFVGHSESINVEFEKPISAEFARSILREAPGCLVIDKKEDGGYMTPQECAGEDATYISRIRADATVENGLVLWVVSDNLRKGAALNTIQIAETIINRNLMKKVA